MSALHASNVDAPKSASVEVLTAEVRVLVVGKRQITLSVYRQLDTVAPDAIEPWGRVRASAAAGPGEVEIIGRAADGQLVRSSIAVPYGYWRHELELERPAIISDWFDFGPTRRGHWPKDAASQVGNRDDLPATPKRINVLQRDGFTAYVTLPEMVPVTPGLPDGQLTWRTEEVKAEALATATDWIREARMWADRYDHFSGLPLIVLAGLK